MNAFIQLLKERLKTTQNTPFALAESALEALLTPSLVTQLERLEARGGEVHLWRDGERIFAIEASLKVPGERSICYDEVARLGRKKFPSPTSAEAIALAYGATLMDEGLYAQLQSVRACDTVGSLWLATPPSIRSLGGALYGERKFGRVFIGANGAESYYQDRGCRLVLCLN
jgi:hypothetical protein